MRGEWIVLALAIALCTGSQRAARAAEWTAPVEVRYDVERCVSYRARWSGEHLVVQALLDPGWHTFTMDNARRATEKLAGRRSLGIDRPTEIAVTDGLEVVGPWFQSSPKDFSNPELRWFSWGFEGQVVFAARVRRSGAGPARIAIRGQACSADKCKNVDVELSLPLGRAGRSAGGSGIDLENLMQVR